MQVRQLHGDYFVSAQLSTDGIRLAAEHGVRTIINNRPDHEEPGQPLSEDLQRAAEAAGLVYRHLPFASADIPEGILGALRDGYADMPKPVLAFCRSGARSEMLWARVVAPLAAED